MAGSTISMQGAGADIWGRSDQFRFAYRTLSGDGEIVARVSSVEPVDPWTKAGVMIRQSISPQSAHALMLVSAGRGLAFQRRRATGGATTHTAGSGGSAPQWVKLVRRGQTIVASRSDDGTSWTVVGEDTLPGMGPSVLVGVAVSSHAPSQLATAVFESVDVVVWLPWKTSRHGRRRA
jgi:hypothetical protein